MNRPQARPVVQPEVNPVIPYMRDMLQPLLVAIKCTEGGQTAKVLHTMIALNQLQKSVHRLRFPMDWMFVIVISESVLEEPALTRWRRTNPAPSLLLLQRFFMKYLNELLGEQAAQERVAPHNLDI